MLWSLNVALGANINPVFMYRNPMRRYDMAYSKPKALKRDYISIQYILICCSRKKGFRHSFTFTIKALTYADVPARLAHFAHS